MPGSFWRHSAVLACIFSGPSCDWACTLRDQEIETTTATDVVEGLDDLDYRLSRDVPVGSSGLCGGHIYDRHQHCPDHEPDPAADLSSGSGKDADAPSVGKLGSRAGAKCSPTIRSSRLERVERRALPLPKAARSDRPGR